MIFCQETLDQESQKEKEKLEILKEVCKSDEILKVNKKLDEEIKNQIKQMRGKII